jgi:pantoate--beta-alanine ligase
VALHHALAAAAAAVSDGERRAEALIGAAREAMTRFDVEPEYLAFVNPDTLEPVEHLHEPALLAVAARVGSTRLIDNITLYPAISPNPPQANPREATIACSA